MPHFGLIEPGIPEDEEALIRSRLHWKAGLIRLSRGMIADGIAVLYDALSTAMLRFVLSPDLKKELFLTDDDFPDLNLDDDLALFGILRRSGIIDDTYTSNDFEDISDTAYNAIDGKLNDFNEDMYVSKIENLLTELRILPFEESELPQGESITL